MLLGLGICRGSVGNSSNTVVVVVSECGSIWSWAWQAKVMVECGKGQRWGNRQVGFF